MKLECVQGYFVWEIGSFWMMKGFGQDGWSNIEN